MTLKVHDSDPGVFKGIIAGYGPSLVFFLWSVLYLDGSLLSPNASRSVCFGNSFRIPSSGESYMP